VLLNRLRINHMYRILSATFYLVMRLELFCAFSGSSVFKYASLSVSDACSSAVFRKTFFFFAEPFWPKILLAEVQTKSKCRRYKKGQVVFTVLKQ
jgi:hypothetical protein